MDRGHGVPIGVDDCKGRPIHVGDRLRFDPGEWGGECEFVVAIKDGVIQHPGAASDLTSFCEIIRPHDNGSPYASPIECSEKPNGISSNILRLWIINGIIIGFSLGWSVGVVYSNYKWSETVDKINASWRRAYQARPFQMVHDDWR